MKVITLTLNPAFDIHVYAKSFKCHEETIGSIKSIECGGKGINISRALKANDIDSMAIVIVGKDNKESFINNLKSDGIDTIEINTDGRIRENITIHDDSNLETRLSFEGFEVKKDIINDVKKAIGDVDENTIITLTGSIPKGLDINDIKSLLNDLKNKNAKIVIDSRSFSISDIKDIKPWLIKPNYPEFCNYFSLNNPSVEIISNIAKDLNACGVNNVIISLGEKGAILVNNNSSFFIHSPSIKVSSTIGAGDSFIAGFIAGHIKGYDDFTSLKLAISNGSAKCLNEGSVPPSKKQIKEVFDSL